MRVAHLSDLHLGFRAFPRIERGWNLRERDVATAFHHAIQELGRLRPDAVVVSGNVFDHPDPPSTAFLTLSRGVRTLQELLPGVPVLAIAGERDTPATPADPGPVAVLDALPGVDAAAGAPRSVHLGAIGAHVLLVPYRSVVRPPFPDLRPDPAARWNVLVLRGRPASAADRPLLDLDPEGWDYVALGAGQSARRWAKRIHSAGALERIGFDPWRDPTRERGFLLADLASSTVEFHSVPGRPVVDLAPVRVDPDDRDAGSRRLREVLDGVPGGIEGKLLRIRLRGEADEPGQVVAPGLLEAVRRRAAHVELRLGREPTADGRVAAPGTGRASPSPPLLRWRTGAGREGRLLLTPGLWGFTAARAPDRRILVEALAGAIEAAGQDRRPAPPGVQGAGEADRLRLVLELPPEADSALLRLGGLAPADGSDPVQLLALGAARLEGAGAAGGDPEPPAGAPGPLEALEAELSRLRGDWIEAAGDLEARTLEWGRERQEAHSRLGAYRDRARELRERIAVLEEQGPAAPCPGCGRALGKGMDAFLAALREEWEEVVQDGKWWRRRLEQLDDKPGGLRTLERRALELRARVEEAGERLEAARAASSRAPGERTGGLSGKPPGPVARALLRRTGGLLRRLTEGNVDGLVFDPDGGIRILEGGLGGRPAGAADNALLRPAIRLALAREAALRAAHPVPLAFLGELDGRASAGPAVRMAELVALEGAGASAALAVLDPADLARVPEAFQGSLELVRDSDGRPRVRVHPAGRPGIGLAEPAVGAS